MANINGCVTFFEGNLLLLQSQSNLRTDVILTDDSQKVTKYLNNPAKISIA